MDLKEEQSNVSQIFFAVMQKQSNAVFATQTQIESFLTTLFADE